MPSMSESADLQMPSEGQPYQFASVLDYISLLKPRVMSLVIFTAIAGLVVAPGDMNPVLAISVILAIALGAGGSAALNMWYDSDIDSIMSRTRRRAIPLGKINRADALGLGIFLSLISVTIMAISSNYAASALLAFSIFFYAVIYTIWLKRSTPQNIVIGGAAGAFPPVIAWMAVTGSAPLEAWMLFAIIFVWTPPHFWALALIKNEDYIRANIPMMPSAKGAKPTRWRILAYTFILAPLGVLPAFTEMAGQVYFWVSMTGGLIFIVMALDLMRTKAGDMVAVGDENARAEAGSRTVRMGEKSAYRLFAFSIFYLFGLFLALLTDNTLIASNLLGVL